MAINGVCLTGVDMKDGAFVFDVMGYQVIGKMLDLELEYRIPIGFGIIGPGATLYQAKDRLKDSVKNAVGATVRMHEFTLELKKK